MARLVSQWRESGESRARFARRHHIHPWTFWYWCRKLSDEAPTGEASLSPTPTFVPVHMAADTSAPVIEIVLSGGERLHIGAGASPALVQTVVATLRSRC
jgi:transposase-like protein